MMNVAIVGAGKLSFRVAEALLGGDYAITIIDKNNDVLQKLSQQLDVMTINADARDISVLKNLDIKDFQYHDLAHLWNGKPYKLIEFSCWEFNKGDFAAGKNTVAQAGRRKYERNGCLCYCHRLRRRKSAAGSIFLLGIQ